MNTTHNVAQAISAILQGVADEGRRFQSGHTYYTRSVCDSDLVISETIVSRTARTVTTKKGKTFRVTEFDGVEFIKPWGSYSMAPRISADKRAS